MTTIWRMIYGLLHLQTISSRLISRIILSGFGIDTDAEFTLDLDEFQEKTTFLKGILYKLQLDSGSYDLLIRNHIHTCYIRLYSTVQADIFILTGDVKCENIVT